MFIAFICRPAVFDLFEDVGRRFRRIPQHSLIEGVPWDSHVIRQMNVFRRSSYTFEHHDEGYTITGIACGPVSEDLQSPEANVVDGGLNHSYVVIRLTPELDEEYGCRIVLVGKRRTTTRFLEVAIRAFTLPAICNVLYLVLLFFLYHNLCYRRSQRRSRYCMKFQSYFGTVCDYISRSI